MELEILLCPRVSVSHSVEKPISCAGQPVCRMELTPFNDFNTALDKALGKLGSQPKQVIKF